MIYTTLNKIRAHSPCSDGWAALLSGLGKTGPDDEPLSIAQIADINGLRDALWCLCTVPEENNRWRLLAVRYARTVQHLMRDKRSIAALDVAERHAHVLATDDELRNAWAAAAASATEAAWATAAAWAAAAASAAPATAAAWAAAAASAAASEAPATAAAASAAAASAASASAEDMQLRMLLDILDEEIGNG